MNEDEIECLLSAQEGETNFLLENRPSSTPDLQTTTINRDDDFQRCNSWNGCTAHEREEMEKFFVDEEEGNRNKQSEGGIDENDSKYSRYLRKAGAAVVGGSMVGAGIIMIPLPGPGILVMGAGASVLAKEFPAAQRALDGAKGYCNSIMESTKARTSKKGGDAAAAGGNDDTSTSTAIDQEGIEQTLDGSDHPVAAGDSANTTTATPTTTTTTPTAWGSRYRTNFLSMGRSLKDGFDKGAKQMYERSKRFGTIGDQLGSKSDLGATTAT